MAKYEPKHVAAFRVLNNRCCVWRILVGFLVHVMQLDNLVTIPFQYSLLYNGYRVFPGGKVRPGRAADHSLHSSVAVMEQ